MRIGAGFRFIMPTQTVSDSRKIYHRRNIDCSLSLERMSRVVLLIVLSTLVSVELFLMLTQRALPRANVPSM